LFPRALCHYPVSGIPTASTSKRPFELHPKSNVVLRLSIEIVVAEAACFTLYKQEEVVEGRHQEVWGCFSK
jgi:hypothetical protein